MPPLDMPASGVGQQVFEIARIDYSSPTNGGRSGATSAGYPRWRAEYTVGRAGEVNSDTWRAFVDRLNGGQNPFFGRDVNRPYPRAHAGGFGGMTRAGGGAFDGSTTSWSLDATRTLLTLNTLPVGLILSLADYGDFRWSTDQKRSLHRVVTAAVANGSGVATVEVAPAVPPWVAGGTKFSLDRPCCVMRRLPETRLGAMDRRKSIGGVVIALQEHEA